MAGTVSGRSIAKVHCGWSAGGYGLCSRRWTSRRHGLRQRLTVPARHCSEWVYVLSCEYNQVWRENAVKGELNVRGCVASGRSGRNAGRSLGQKGLNYLG